MANTSYMVGGALGPIYYNDAATNQTLTPAGPVYINGGGTAPPPPILHKRRRAFIIG